jgi:hypothetical protein
MQRSKQRQLIVPKTGRRHRLAKPLFPVHPLPRHQRCRWLVISNVAMWLAPSKSFERPAGRRVT